MRTMRTIILACLLLMTAAIGTGAGQPPPPESTLQMRLARSTTFQTRVIYLRAQQARVVLAERGVGATHACRALYAQRVMQNLGRDVFDTAVVIAGGVNLVRTIQDNASSDLVDSTASDPAIISQLATFWNALSGCDTGT